MGIRIPDVIAIVGGAMITAAVLLPWANDMTGLGFSSYLRGLEGIIYSIASFGVYLIAIVGIGIIIETLYSIYKYNKGKDDTQPTFFGYFIIVMILVGFSAFVILSLEMSLGAGIFVCLAGCAVVMSSGIMITRNNAQ